MSILLLLMPIPRHIAVRRWCWNNMNIKSGQSTTCREHSYWMKLKHKHVSRNIWTFFFTSCPSKLRVTFMSLRDTLIFKLRDITHVSVIIWLSLHSMLTKWHTAACNLKLSYSFRAATRFVHFFLGQTSHLQSFNTAWWSAGDTWMTLVSSVKAKSSRRTTVYHSLSVCFLYEWR